ncbi:MAG: hypothetical protein IV100_11975 [Myxococcales bacterium]|nr:hypothetical protein [Myxococcales bacterium]
MIAHLVGLAVVGGVFGTPPDLHVTVAAPPECADALSLEAEVTTCLSEVPSGTKINVQLTSRGPGFTAQIELQQGDQPSRTRVIELPRGTCSDALRAVALAICIALDSAASPWTPTGSGAREAEPPQSRARAYRDVAFGPAVSWRPPAVSLASADPVGVRLQVGPVLAIGLTPNAALGITAGAAVVRSDWRVDIAVTHLPSSRFEVTRLDGLAGGSGLATSLDVSWTGASVTALWQRRPWLLGAWVLAGAHAARQRGFEGDADTPISPYTAVGGRLGIEVPLVRGVIPIDVGVHVDVGGSLLRGRYVVETAEGLSAVWVPPSVVVLIGLTLSAEVF